MFEVRNYRRPLFYFLVSLFIIWLIFLPEVSLTAKDGFFIILFVMAVHYFIEKGCLANKVSNQMDKHNDFMKVLLNNCPDLIYRKDATLNYLGCNDTMLNMLDIDDSDMLYGKSDYHFFSRETAKRIRTYEKIVMHTGKIVSYKIEKKCKNGEIKIYDVFVAPIKENNLTTGIVGIMRDITHIEELKQKIMLQNAQLNAMLDNIPFILYLKDSCGRCINVNRQLELIIDLPREKIIGKTANEIFKSKYKLFIDNELRDFDYIQKDDEQIIKEKKGHIIEQKALCLTTNQEEWLKIIKSPIFDRYKNVIGIIVVIENITKAKAIESQKETFVATLTHDLKTPTNAQTRAMKLLQEEILGHLNNDQKEMIEQTLNSNLYMSELISTILTTYKSDTGETVLNKESFDFCELVHNTCKEISNLAREKSQKIIFQTNVTNKITADKLQIKRVIINLVSNAITYGYKNSDIKIKLDEDKDNITFNVENHSNYIKTETLKEIFEKYKTAPSAKFNKASTGLGLYLSKQIINSHKGEIYADSRQSDEVCIFGFSIPKVPSETEKSIKQ